jgi:hypothetical protein
MAVSAFRLSPSPLARARCRGDGQLLLGFLHLGFGLHVEQALFVAPLFFLLREGLLGFEDADDLRRDGAEESEQPAAQGGGARS